MTRKRPNSEMGTRASKRRKADDPLDAAVPAVAPVTAGRRQSSRVTHEDPNVFSADRCAAWFSTYTDDDPAKIGPEGIEKFCNDIGIAPGHVVVLIIAWRLGAAAMCYFSRGEWMTGMHKLNVDTPEKMRALLPKLPDMSPAEFKELYRYSFDFARDPSQKSLEIETAKEMLALLLEHRWPSLGQFLEYLGGAISYKVINKDQWMSIFEFSSTIKPDLSNYDEMGAWPVVLDEFVEWLRDGHRI